MIKQLENLNGGERASRKYLECHNKEIQKNGNSIESKIDRKPLSWRKHFVFGNCLCPTRYINNSEKPINNWDYGGHLHFRAYYSG